MEEKELAASVLEYLTKRFMENVVILFGMVTIIVVDSVSKFKSVFKDMCTSLGIIYWCLAHGDNKGMRV